MNFQTFEVGNRVLGQDTFGPAFGHIAVMTAVPLGDGKNHLSEYVSHVQNTHDRVTITGHMSGMVEGIAEGLADCASGRQRGITCSIHDHVTSPLCDVRISARAVGRAAMPIAWE